MKCQDVSELIPAVLDGELRAEEQQSIQHHLNTCSQCRNELELHSMAKRIVQQRLQRVAVPQRTAQAIFSTLEKEKRKQTASMSWLENVPFRLSWKPIAVFGGAFAVLLVMFLLKPEPVQPLHIHSSPTDADIMHQTLNNFDKLLAGTLTPQINSSNPFDVEQFFAQKARFNVRVPKMRQCELKGGMYSRVNDAHVAHVLYEAGNKPIYVYQVKLNDILNENPLMLPCNVKEELLQNGWYVSHHSPTCTMVLRLRDSTVVCMIADLPKEELLSYFDEN